MEQHDTIATPTVALLDMKLPPFRTSDLTLQFIQAEALFATRRITADTTKYHYVVVDNPPATVSEVRDILLAPPADLAYQVLKEALICRLTLSKLECLRQLLHKAELSDRRPSQLLHQLQQLAGDKTSLDSRLVRELFLQRLPTTVQIGVTA
ncbi:hypothetical protein MRX96_003448 [Rhipicephalus microplus]